MFKSIYFALVALILFAIPETSFSQWVKIFKENNSSRILLDIYFLPANPDYGWICGKDARVLRTTDRGQTWIESKIYYNTQGDAGFFESIIFLNPHIGYVSGPSGLYKSTDGGATWKLCLDEYVWGCYFVNEVYGVATGGGCSDSQQIFYLTTDGGVTWTNQIYNESNTGMTDLYLTSTTGLGLAVSSGNIWISYDGGKNWSIRNSTGNNDWHEELSFKGNTFILPYSTGCHGGNGKGGVRFSLDGGFTFRVTNLEASMFGSFVISDSVGWVCGRNNTVVQTKDAGFTWESYNCGLKVEDDMDDIYFIDDTTGFVVGLGIYKYQLPKKHKAKIKVIDSTLCDNTPLILEAEGDYEYYDWNGFPGFKQKEVKQSGTYILSVYNMECDTIISDTITLNLKTPAKLNISDLSEAKCVGDSILLNPDLSNVVSYSWSDNFAEVSRKIFTDTDLTLVVEDTSGCLQEFNFSYKFIPLPKVNFKDYKSNTCRNEHVILEAEIENATTYHWYNRNKRLISNSPTLEVQNGEEYYIVAENSLGCSSVSDTIAISYEYIENQVSIMPLEGSNNIDLGEMEVLSPLSFTIEVNNTSDQEFVLEEAFMEANTCFSIPKSQFPLVIVANSTAELAVNFYCADYGELKDKLILRDRCDYDSIEVAIERLFYSFEANTKCEVPLKVTNVKMKYPRITHSHLSQNKGKITTYLEYIAEKDEPVLLTVYNTLGRKLFEVEPDNIIINKSGDFSFCEISTEIDMTQYSDGLYFLHIRIGGEYVVLNLTNFK